jgi:tRNA threonylcarbamoyladenosine biosynthesis protein TsaB
MPVILNIETATPLCSVSLAFDGLETAHRETLEEKSHAARLTVFIEQILKEVGLTIKDLNAVAVGRGPGSYTGLRIGVSTAKGLCYGANLPLIGICTLKTLFYQAISNPVIHAETAERYGNALFCPMIDARRMEVFTCLYHASGKEAEAVSAKIIEKDTFSQLLSSRRIYFFGSGMEKCREILTHPNAVFLEAVYPHAKAMATLSEESYQYSRFENLAYFEPFYLKDFVATTPKNSLRI